MNKVEQQIKEKLDRPASNGRGQCPSETPGDARDASTEHFQQEDKSMLFCIPVCIHDFFIPNLSSCFFSLPEQSAME